MKNKTKKRRGGKFNRGVQCLSKNPNYEKIKRLSSYISSYNWSIHKTTGHFCDLFIWLGDNDSKHIHAYSIKGNIVEFSVKYEDGSHIHHQQVSLENETDYDYRNALDVMCKFINVNHISFNQFNLQSPERTRINMPIKPAKSAKKSRTFISDSIRNPKKLGPTAFKSVASNI